MSKHAAVPAAQLWRGLSLLHSSIQHLRLTETWNRHTSTYLNISFPDDRYLHHIIIPCKDSHLICPLVLQTFIYLFCDRCKCTIIKNTVCHCIVITLYFILHWTQCRFFLNNLFSFIPLFFQTCTLDIQIVSRLSCRMAAHCRAFCCSPLNRDTLFCFSKHRQQRLSFFYCCCCSLQFVCLWKPVSW